MLNGKVEVTPKEDGRIDPVQLLKATYDSGVSVAEMNMIARGRIVKTTSGGLALEVQPSQSFTITPNDLSRQLEKLAGSPTMVTIRGQLYTKPTDNKKRAPPTSLNILILEIQEQE